MSNSSSNHIAICDYSMHLYYEAGHIDTTIPIYENHSASHFVYFDGADSISIEFDQKVLLNSFDNVSFLFALGNETGCFQSETNETINYYSVELECPRINRSQIAYEVHKLIHSIIVEPYTIITFLHGNDILFSFACDNGEYVMSDWFDGDNDYYTLIDKISIANVSLNSPFEYYSDLTYVMARDDFFHPRIDEFDAYSALNDILEPGDRFLFKKKTESQLRDLFQLNIEKDEEDYFDFSKTSIVGYVDTANMLDEMLMDIELEADKDEETLLVDSVDEFEYDDIDSSVFDNPESLLAYLDKTEDY